MSIEFRPASIDGVAIFVAIAGASRSGKTYSALRLARGIAGVRKIAAIDTETKRMSHYSREFQFDVYNMRPPFRPAKFLEGARRAEAAGYAVLVIDSFSSEWTGAGGVLDWHEEELTRLVGAVADEKEREKQRNKKGQTAWIKPKQAHKAMMTGFLQLSIPVIFCLRAEDKTKPDAFGVPQKIGWVPTQDKSFMYEWTVSLTLSPEAPGVINYSLPHKVEQQHRPLFPEGQLIGEEAGAALYAWANSDSVGSRQSSGVRQADGRQAGEAARSASASSSPSLAPEACHLPADDGPARGETGPPPGLPGGGPGEDAPVRPLARKDSRTADARKAQEFVDGLLAEVALAQSTQSLQQLLRVETTQRRMERLRDAWPELHDRISAAVAARYDALPPF